MDKVINNVILKSLATKAPRHKEKNIEADMRIGS
jgi:hypothetical protein